MNYQGTTVYNSFRCSLYAIFEACTPWWWSCKEWKIFSFVILILIIIKTCHTFWLVVKNLTKHEIVRYPSCCSRPDIYWKMDRRTDKQTEQSQEMHKTALLGGYWKLETNLTPQQTCNFRHLHWNMNQWLLTHYHTNVYRCTGYYWPADWLYLSSQPAVTYRKPRINPKVTHASEGEGVAFCVHRTV